MISKKNTIKSNKYGILIGLIVCLLSQIILTPAYAFPRGAHEVSIPQTFGVRTDLMQNIAPIIEKSIAKGNYPGAVVLIGHKGKIIYRGVFGHRRILPTRAPMKADTIFDIASLTKVVATTPAIMQLVEQGKINLDAPVANYWPQFAAKNKNKITVRELLTHTSGLPADVSTEKNILKKITQLKLKHSPGKTFLYSDVNFIVLAHLVEIISKENFSHYVQHHIFQPLHMSDTAFLPAKKLRDRIAPTEMIHKKLRWGEVQDPIARALGGISGNAGLFSTAHDLGIYAQALLDGGAVQHNAKHKKHFLGPLSITKMTTPQTPEIISDTRGLGWDIDSRYSNRGALFPVQSYGHTGWTGTSLWIDPVTQTWIVMLTSRAHPHAAEYNQLVEDRRTIATIVSASIIDIAAYSLNNTGKGELTRAYQSRA